MKNKKGFTLIELLAVIVILGVLLAIAIPKVTQYITRSRKDSFLSAGKFFIETVQNDTTTEEIPLPIQTNEVVIVTFDKANLNKSKEKSAFGGNYVYNKSYVAVINIGTGTDPEYEFYFAAQDTKGYAVPLTKEKDLAVNKVVANAKNKMEVTIQSLCGSELGTTTVLPSISGLTLPEGAEAWEATIYSTSACSSQNGGSTTTTNTNTNTNTTTGD